MDADPHKAQITLEAQNEEAKADPLQDEYKNEAQRETDPRIIALPHRIRRLGRSDAIEDVAEVAEEEDAEQKYACTQ